LVVFFLHISVNDKRLSIRRILMVSVENLWSFEEFRSSSVLDLTILDILPYQI